MLIIDGYQRDAVGAQLNFRTFVTDEMEFDPQGRTALDQTILISRRPT